MKHLFDYDGTLNQFLAKIMYMVSVNLLFLLFSLPIVTMGAAATGMYTVLLRYHQGDNPDIIKTFVAAFKENFIKATIVWGCMLMGILFMGIGLYFLPGMALLGGLVPAALLLLAVGIGILWIYLFPAMCYYENSITGYLRYSMLLAVAKLPYTICLLLIQGGILFMTLTMAQLSTFGVMLFVCVGFSAGAYLSAPLILKLFSVNEKASYE